LGIRIAIDGPASSGKGTVARLVAEALGYRYVDTGSMYRCVALAAQRAGVSWEDEAALRSLTERLSLRFGRSGASLVVYLNDEDVSATIRSPELGQGASRVSVHAGVREALLSVQRALGEPGGVVMEGRDIGTVVLPGAELKVFLDADVEVRATRRASELERRGGDVTLAAVVAELRERDARDRGRAVSPLRQATDAVYLDTSKMDASQAASAIVAMARELG
jgi:cytidylate kinase